METGIALTNTDLFFKDDCSADATDGNYIFGHDFGSFSQSSDLMNAGISSLSSQLFAELTLSTSHSTRMDSWAQYDSLMIVDLSTQQLAVRF
jgi:hypothetical protein